MADFPGVFRKREPKKPPMSLRGYARFSEQCLKSNSRITPENCLRKRADEAAIRVPFSLKDR